MKAMRNGVFQNDIAAPATGYRSAGGQPQLQATATR